MWIIWFGIFIVITGCCNLVTGFYNLFINQQEMMKLMGKILLIFIQFFKYFIALFLIYADDNENVC